ncbi:hypothetical protein [Plantibacter flavus]|uniref:hypothetical protein n=1 Tax=Plantibacter flavus TaxID=150123 RepID=UPI000F48948D|nr:hypothetical protein [Plantibacter flavus]
MSELRIDSAGIARVANHMMTVDALIPVTDVGEPSDSDSDVCVAALAEFAAWRASELASFHEFLLDSWEAATGAARAFVEADRAAAEAAGGTR